MGKGFTEVTGYTTEREAEFQSEFLLLTSELNKRNRKRFWADGLKGQQVSVVVLPRQTPDLLAWKELSGPGMGLRLPGATSANRTSVLLSVLRSTRKARRQGSPPLKAQRRWVLSPQQG